MLLCRPLHKAVAAPRSLEDMISLNIVEEIDQSLFGTITNHANAILYKKMHPNIGRHGQENIRRFKEDR